VICSDDVYGGTNRLFNRVIANNGIQFSMVDLADLNKLREAIKPNTKLVWVETPTNPTLKLIDVAAVAKVCREKGVLVAVDNTFMSPYFQKPLLLGADIVMHSTTKFVNGHSDMVGGALIVNDDALNERLRFLQNSIGAVQGPFDSWLAMRGLKTLAVRMDRHAQNAMTIAKYLEKHSQVQKVTYPGLESHAQHALAKKQMSGFGGMITFWIKGGLPASRAFLEKVRIFALAESLGGVESLIEHPAIMTHASVPADQRKLLGIDDSMIRLSVGIEHVDDLLADLENAFKS
jgi:cystathionine gamma-lyase